MDSLGQQEEALANPAILSVQTLRFIPHQEKLQALHKQLV